MSADLTKAIRVLDEAYERYERMESEIARTINAFTDAIKDEVGSVTNGAGSIEAFYDKSSFITRISKFLGLTNIAVNITGDISSAKSWKEIGIGIIVDGVTWGISNTLRKGKKAIAVFGMGDVVDKIFDEFNGAFDLRSAIQDFFKDYDIDKDSLQKGILRVTMKDGTVYARPLKGTNSSGNYSLFGGSGIKDDVLFGGNGNDMLIGHGGADLLIGGNGKDDYFVDNGDTIKDSDGKGRVFLSYTNIQLTGGTQIEKGSKIYKGKDGVKYELKGSDLIINDSITIENFNPYADEYLGITLYEADEIAISVSNASAKEKEQSMSFTISLSRNLKENEFIKVTIPKIGNNEAKTYMFIHSSSTDWKVADGIEYIFDSSTTYTYSWSDLEFANLNLLIA